MSHFQRLQISGKDASQFLQGQLTINVNRLTQAFMPCAICNLKGRVQFGLWVRLDDDSYEMVVASDLAQALIAHLKKYGAFSKIAISEPIDIFPTVIDGLLSFTDRADSACDWLAWMTTSIETGNA